MTRKLRICYVLNTYGIGGAETVVLDLARGHDRDRFEVEVVAAIEPDSPAEPEMRRRFREAGIRTHAIHQRNFRSPAALLRFYRFLRGGRFDIVHGHNRGSDLWAVRLGRLARVPQLYWTRHLVYADMTPRQAVRYRKASRDCGRVIAVSETVARYSREVEGIDAERLVTVVNGIDLGKFAPVDEATRQAVRAELGLGAGERLLLFVGRFSEQKAPEAFPALVRRLRARGLPVRGFMCGYGALEGRLRELAGDPAAATVVLGLRSDIPRLLGGCDLFVSTSRNEGLPLNVMEAMAAGAPFVAPGIPQIRELTAEVALLDGQLFAPPPAAGEVPPELLDAWAETVASVLGDVAVLPARGAAGRDVIRHRFALERMVGAYESIFLAAAAAGGRRP